jgi:hypothetical protein
MVVQELGNCDMESCSIVADCLLGILSSIVVLMTDEANFQLSGFVNKQNFHCWAEENPQQLYQWPLHSAHMTDVAWQTSEIFKI